MFGIPRWASSAPIVSLRGVDCRGFACFLGHPAFLGLCYRAVWRKLLVLIPVFVAKFFFFLTSISVSGAIS
ncbi:hypothetical protein P175DRAFT_0212509 [Aspergillus ochraceoroseus IBT 24754]|uniref:Uncharacterized protein n=1 Tax=Aspergillus ochraceoroseus IBT 24754 TaxID=1392256 RepID=A0A2T5M0Q3_9EURO|nr:uncharacterized protein P175DRAFT_0212509 [Aspergillus ochraceoroseus IBT 24754]PTU22111.1 hypothetical protein P175DRAFT_0212509 [Aspergillus ochraceoroseus IBT 24754]